MPADPWEYPEAQGLYDPSNESAACGVGFIVNIDGIPSPKIIRDAERLSSRMTHRGARSHDNDTGDGAGLLAGIPDSYYRDILGKEGVKLPPKGQYATGIIYVNPEHRKDNEKKFEALVAEQNLKVIHWRSVPTDRKSLGAVALKTEPLMRQVFLVPASEMDENELRIKVWVTRKRATHTIPKPGHRFYICSLSPTTIVYKGQLTSDQLWTYFVDLASPKFETYLALVHTRFSTNTFPSWERAHPLRLMAHNGEINTLKGNVNLMKAREGVMKSSIFGKEISKLYPVVEPNLSDSGAVDCCLEFLVMAGGRSLPEAIMTMVPEAWHNDPLMHPEKKDFYRWAACVMEPWDGPALMTFTDGRYIGAILDRNGLRPSRYYVTKDHILVMASEVGVYDTEPQNIIHKGRLKPGRMLLVDTKEKIVVKDETIKLEIARSRPHAKWITEQFTLDDLYKAHEGEDDGVNSIPNDCEVNCLPDSSKQSDEKSIRDAFEEDKRLAMFGYTIETLNMLLLPMVKTQKEALGSMGNDSPLACLSEYQPLIYDYFKQLFAQVTNPPIDPFRERVVMSLACPIGPQANILEPSEQQCHRLNLKHPVISIRDLEVIKDTQHRDWKTTEVDITYPKEEGWEGLITAIDRICEESCRAAAEGYQVLVLTDRKASSERVPVSTLMALGATHHYLIEERQRMKVGLILETGEAREVHHMCVLLGYGADAICPYLVLESMTKLRDEGVLAADHNDVVIFKNYVSAMERGIAKVMAKMGISTLQSYKGAQIFEAVGIASEIIDKCFKGTPSRIGGVTFEVLGNEALQRHEFAYNNRLCDSLVLRNPGFYHWRSGGEKHMNDPDSIADLQEATRSNNQSQYNKFLESTMESIRNCTLRGQLEVVKGTDPIDISEVEPATEIIKRFATGAMSFGSISIESHTTLAIAMNRVKGKSNTGEGGENADRYENQHPDFNKRSAIKQVASGRFGVTAAYLANADDLQIKMAQGAKPGEGGELPGYKVTDDIAKTRHSVPGVGLISPPPHHDIYSIEDLAELIYDLKASNPNARISVKLVSEQGVGVVAAGVAKGKAEHITISGHDGGTGASSWTGIKNAGLPWELGISETHQTLVLNDLRSRVVLQADGQIRCGFDIVVAALLGADEFGFSTAPLIVMGCTMMRKCHLNTCPVGIATQDPILRKKFEGKPEYVVNYMFLLAEEVRGIMASLGIRKFSDLVGRTDLLQVRSDVSSKVKLLNFDRILMNALHMRPNVNIYGGSVEQEFELENRQDLQLLEKSAGVIEGTEKSVRIEMEIHNESRTFGSTLSYHIATKYGEAGLPEGSSIDIHLKGSAGQSFCAFLAKGVSVTLEGDANDYVGKGLSGGHVTIFPQKDLPPEFKTEENVIVGNVCLYGATTGTAFFRGIAAERFCVRNSGAVAVVEGVGDHGCEYMTGGTVLILGLTGRNFAAGMSGGIAYVYDVIGDFTRKCNLQMVELVQLIDPSEVELIRDLMDQFQKATGSEVAKELLSDWPAKAERFVKVFPYEYQKALQKERERTAKVEEVTKEKAPDILDIEDSVKDVSIQKKKMEIVLDKTSECNFNRNLIATMAAMPKMVVFHNPKILIIATRGQNCLQPIGFVKYQREPYSYRNIEKRQEDWGEIYDFEKVRKGLQMQAARCMECGVPFCQSSHGCPLGNIIPKWNDLIFNNNWKEALLQLLQTNNFPEFTGRVCPAPCEGACVLGINELPVTIKNIECAIIDHAFEQGWIVPHVPPSRTGKKVAVVGSGPAGMAAAHQLNKAGHYVTVYERNDRVGGLLQYGIPTMKLSKEVVQRRVKLLQEEGVEFKTNVDIGKDIKASDLVSDFDAVVLCMGATWPRDLPIPGRELGGIEFAMNFLETWQKKQLGNTIDHERITAKGKDVIVIGGGDTGCDCIATSLRQGANTITTFEILPQPPPSRGKDNPWPTFPRVFKVDYGHEEVKLKFGNDPRQYSTTTKEFISDGNGNVSGVKTVQVEWNKDQSGRWQMKEVEGSEKTFKADLILLAMGFLGPEKYIIEELQLKQDPRSNIQTSKGRYASSVDKVFAAGDCRRGQSLIVWAINEGRQAARDVDRYLMGNSTLPGSGGVIQIHKRG